ncbi:primosomal replication protein PriC [Gallaecimonas sp. GXIMD4217]|uniref:primosomal replication protein PriC n=1 Tax=Gallaecimonas sp. GXIMD4217 TaxID=3131927 RepID=UPI00311B107D
MNQPLIDKLRAACRQLAEEAGTLDRARELRGKLAEVGRPLFPRGLFHGNGRAFTPYAMELEQNLAQLAEQLHSLSPEALTRRLARIEDQFTALKRAMAQHQLADATSPKRWHKAARALVGRYQPLYGQLAQYWEFEQRLLGRIRQLKDDSVMTVKQQGEILKLYQRLGRCRQAITELEERLAALESAWRG